MPTDDFYRNANVSSAPISSSAAPIGETAELGRAAGHDYIDLTAMASLAYLRMEQGRLRGRTPRCGRPSGSRPNAKPNYCLRWDACASG